MLNLEKILNLRGNSQLKRKFSTKEKITQLGENYQVSRK